MTKIKEISEAKFNEEVLESTIPVLVKFGAPWCGPCKVVAPILEALESEQDKVKIVEVNIDDSFELAVEYQVRGVPTFMYFSQGKVVKTKTGAMSKSQILDFIKD